MPLARYRDDYWNLLHRYVGLILGIWLLAMGVTGAILAYYREIDVFLNPELFSAFGWSSFTTASCWERRAGCLTSRRG